MPLFGYESPQSEFPPTFPHSSDKDDGMTVISDYGIAEAVSAVGPQIRETANGMLGANAAQSGMRQQDGPQETVLHLRMVIDFGLSIPRLKQVIYGGISNQSVQMKRRQTHTPDVPPTDRLVPRRSSTTHQSQ